MRILITANITPFLYGGADNHIKGLHAALKEYGHDVELLRLPFQFQPESSIVNSMEYCESLSMDRPNGVEIDRLISLQFPSYGICHSDHWVWLMHQHRAVYELFDKQTKTKELTALRTQIHSYDKRVLSKAKRLFSNSRRVAERLKEYNGLESIPLYHPPAVFDKFYCKKAFPYIFYPSRLESLKRQDILIEAARFTKSPIKILIAGDGGQHGRYQELVKKYRISDKVRLLGRISDEEKLAFYARASAVFFAPYDEDYGYITLEAMLASKPVITATDSGGPLEFVQHQQTGWVSEPQPEAIAEILDEIYFKPEVARKMGIDARAYYESLNISWEHVVRTLTAS